MKSQSLEQILLNHPFFRDLPFEDVKFISGCGKNSVFKEGSFIIEEGKPADEFYLIRNGIVSIETHVPQRGSITLQTLKAGDILGWSWLFPPYLWNFDARVIEPVHVLVLDGKCLRAKCDQSPAMGYRLVRKFAEMMTARLRATRLQLLDVYASPSKPKGAL